MFCDCGNTVTGHEFWVKEYHTTFCLGANGKMLNNEWYLGDDGEWIFVAFLIGIVIVLIVASFMKDANKFMKEQKSK